MASDGPGPQFNKPDGFGNHNHDGEEPTENPIYRVKVTGDIFSVGGYSVEVTPGNFVDGFYDTNHPSP